MSEIVLVIPPFSFGGFRKTYNKCPNLGIAIIASLLEKNSYSVKIIDAFALELRKKEILRRIFKEKPEIVGITSVTSNSDVAMDILKSVKEKDKEIITVYGGPHATFASDLILDKDFIDYVVIGEGEYTMLELCNFIIRGKGSESKIKGISYKRKRSIIKTEPRPLIENLDQLPFPAYHLLPMNFYRPNAYLDTKGKFSSMITSRGCPFNCIFCTTPKMWGRWRARSVENVGEEIKLLYDKYRVSQIFFKDDEFTVSQERVEGICDFIVENKLDIIWECLGRVNDINDKILEKMYRAGCRALTFGIEVGYEEGLKKIRKGFTLNQAKKAIDLTKKHGMISVASFMLGFPWEGIDEIKKTIRFARFLNADITEFNMLVPYFGTEIYEIVTEKGLFVKDYSQKLINYSMHEVNPVIRTEHLTAEQLRYWRGKAYLEIFFNPLSLLRSFKSSISFGSVKRKVLGGVELLTVSLRDMLGL
jgi:radical SAM superfamily enzyme YgiQ (UPF0313 family)